MSPSAIKGGAPSLTVFTPAYNRAKLLPRLFLSLCAQTSKDFEWIVVDDGSTDGTDALFETWIGNSKANEFSIQYIKQKNLGKHVAHNLGAANALGSFFVCVDSDDWIEPDAVAIMLSIPIKEEDAGIIFPKHFHRGEPLRADRWFPECVRSIRLSDMRIEYGLDIETVLLFRTSILVEHPFPVFGDERFLSEEVLYLDLPDDVHFLVNSTSFYECEYQDDGLTRNVFHAWQANPLGAIELFLRRYKAARRYRMSRRLFCQAKAIMNLSALMLVLKRTPLDESPNKVASLLLLPASIVLRERRYGKEARNG